MTQFLGMLFVGYMILASSILPLLIAPMFMKQRDCALLNGEPCKYVLLPVSHEAQP